MLQVDMDISPYIKRVARGKHGSEHLDRDEAKMVFQKLLQSDTDMLQLGAFLIAQRMKGETSAELAGFVEAARETVQGFAQFFAPKGAVDLPCYAGKRRSGHAYLAAAMLARVQGVPIVVHGVEHIEERVTAWQVLEAAGVQRASGLGDASAILAADNIVYIDLAELSPDLFRIYNLRPRLGVRSFANTVARLLNPMSCEGQLNGLFHTPYADYMADANVLLGQQRSLVFMGAEGEPELYADRQKLVVKQQGDKMSRISYGEAGVAMYPRELMDERLLKESLGSMLEGKLNEREIAVVNRMSEAFHWASQGEFPEGWVEQ
ncbi:anthranilate phosphoribosyltransferase [Mariprofundus sp. EBB-1]|uniref:anthranilate phosphoribosyltransferase n=1 Tax=Mariprofundus sp. EBB-1 TaxID=2650971 RepID=UPI001F3EBC1D|nr:anthranilate phosphoribosyltransferase [Mariprofundus sp. EBB-1]